MFVDSHKLIIKFQYSIRDVIEQAREEVQVKKMDKLMEAWKQCLMAEKLYHALRKALIKHKEKTGDQAEICEKIEDLCINQEIQEENVTTK